MYRISIGPLFVVFPGPESYKVDKEILFFFSRKKKSDERGRVEGMCRVGWGRRRSSSALALTGRQARSPS